MSRREVLADLEAKNAAMVADMTPEQRAAHEAGNAVCDYVEALAAGEAEHDEEKFETLMAENYKAILTYGSIIGGGAIAKRLGLKLSRRKHERAG